MAKSTRYFAGLINGRIYFRQSPSRVYTGLIQARRGQVSFTMVPGLGLPVTEITKFVFVHLNGLKTKRIIKEKGSAIYTVPSDSWVLATPETMPLIEALGLNPATAA